MQLFDREKLDSIYESLGLVRSIWPKSVEILGKKKNSFKIKEWMRILDSKILPQIDPDYPLLVAISGGGSSGKSTLFNSLIGEQVSAVSSQAGYTRACPV